MEYRILGKTGLKISRMGFGGIPIQRIDAEGTKTLIHELKDAGVNFIDTARGYTVSEEYLGYALEGIREDFVVATKSMSRTKEAMAADIDISLKNLRTDYIDLYQLHNLPPENIAEDTAPPPAPAQSYEAARQARPESGGGFRHLRTDTGREGGLPKNPQRSRHPVLPPVQLLPALQRGHQHFRCLPV